MACRLHASQTPLKNARVVGTRVSGLDSANENSEVLWFLTELFAKCPILTQEVVTRDSTEYCEPT